MAESWRTGPAKALERQNAALLAAEILGVASPELAGRLGERRTAQARAIAEDPANEGL